MFRVLPWLLRLDPPSKPSPLARRNLLNECFEPKQRYKLPLQFHRPTTIQSKLDLNVILKTETFGEDYSPKFEDWRKNQLLNIYGDACNISKKNSKKLKLLNRLLPEKNVCIGKLEYLNKPIYYRDMITIQDAIWRTQQNRFNCLKLD